MATLVAPPRDISNATDAGYRDWVTYLRDTLLSVNPTILTLAPDTGQVDTSTVVRPPSGQITGPFNVFKFDDGLASALYIRLDYVSASPSWLGGVRVTIGAGTDGGGVLLGSLPSRDSVAMGNHTLPSGTMTFSASVAPGFINVTFAPPVADVPHLSFSLCRTNDASGAWTGEGAVLTTATSGGTWSIRTIAFAGDARAAFSGAATLNPFGRSDWTVGGQTVAMPVYYVFAGEVRVNPAIISICRANVSLDTEVDVAVVGLAPSRFRCLPLYYGHAQATGSALRWE